MTDEIKTLLVIGDILMAEEIKRMLEEENIYSLLQSDNPGSSALNAFAGPNISENVTISVNALDYDKAVQIIKNSSFEDLLTD